MDGPRWLSPLMDRSAAACKIHREVVVDRVKVQEVFLDDFSAIAQRNDELLHAVRGVDVHDVPEHRLAADFDHRLRSEHSLFREPRAKPAGQNHCLHAEGLVVSAELSAGLANPHILARVRECEMTCNIVRTRSGHVCAAALSIRRRRRTGSSSSASRQWLTAVRNGSVAGATWMTSAKASSPDTGVETTGLPRATYWNSFNGLMLWLSELSRWGSRQTSKLSMVSATASNGIRSVNRTFGRARSAFTASVQPSTQPTRLTSQVGKRSATAASSAGSVRSEITPR